MEKPQEKLISVVTKLPDKPGVYMFLNSKKEIIYIGKATSLKKRIRSYFDKNIEEKRSPIIAKMVKEARDIKYKEVDSVLEALILESHLIKKHTPIYNTADKDQKSFNYVVITKEKFPRVLMVRERIIHNSSLIIQSSFGPFPYSSELKEALKIVRKIFPFRDKCIPIPPKGPQRMSREQLSDRDWRESEGIFQQKNTPVARETSSGDRPCFNYQIGLCPGVCIGRISEKEYNQTIKHIKTFFEGNKKKLIKNLEKEMKTLAKNKEFEKASVIKKKIFALRHINDIALIKKNSEPRTPYLVHRDSIFRIEAYDIAHISGSNMVGVMTVLENDEINKNEYRKFKIIDQKNVNDTRALKEVLGRRFKHSEWQFPNLIVVDGGVAQINTAEAIVQNLNLKIPVVAVTKDERHKAKEIRGMNQEVRIMNYESENKKKIKNTINEEQKLILKYQKQILLANSEAHRFAISFHRKLRDRI